mmetsp:Transcript_23026/g.30612  ORF Transcript_23026/g.30612 Transcript_23026/m.30612 type:complete len:170 (-) Transcript_23026:216-725(-)
MPGKLTYFDVGARGECIRALCFLANHDYEDNRITPEQFEELKADLPLGALPIWEEDGMTICQSNAILRALGIRFGYYTTEPKTMWEIDSALDYLEENYENSIKFSFKGKLGLETGEEDMAAWESYFDKIVPFLAGRLEKHGKQYIAGTDRLTIADIKVFQVLVLVLEHP